MAGTGIAGDGADGLAALATHLYLPQDVTVGPDGRLLHRRLEQPPHPRACRTTARCSIVAGIGELAPRCGRSDARTGSTTRRRSTFDPQGRLVIAAWHNSRIKRMDPATGELTTSAAPACAPTAATAARPPTRALNLPVAVAFDAAGNMLISDQANQRIRKVDADTQTISTFAGVGPCTTAAPARLGDGGPALSASSRCRRASRRGRPGASTSTPPGTSTSPTRSTTASARSTAPA